MLSVHTNSGADMYQSMDEILRKMPLYSIVSILSEDIYRPQTKLRDGNVSIRVCLSTEEGRRRAPFDHYTWCIGPPTVLTSGGVTIKAHMVGKRAVHILLECFLVYYGDRRNTLSGTRAPLFLVLMAYLHCRIRTRIQIRIRTSNPMAILHYAEVFTHTESDSDFSPNCQLQEWDRNPSLYPSPSPTM